ncbi:DUF732 domain-containing protein [Dietzia sp. UBA5065]|uniref:DUF732 domain-containing protein n=1 Tax=Dietzia sp. UBA5065 TaxID=1946422 RepID=UPI0025C3342D|nr:DUF732 domain-containing protein [Dietzia sp. UBA5065]HMT48898.1 DUF732 domain-containing protein [Dietzia sp.]
MITSPQRMAVVSVCLALAAGATGCGAASESTGATEVAGTVAQAQAGSADTAAEPIRTNSETHFLDELTAIGIPTGMSADTTVEVGIGICRSIAHGAGLETILDRIRPLTSAIAAQDTRLDTAEVGRAIVDASRTHLCG